jgi:hypothetical protein
LCICTKIIEICQYNNYHLIRKKKKEIKLRSFFGVLVVALMTKKKCLGQHNFFEDLVKKGVRSLQSYYIPIHPKKVSKNHNKN